MTTIHKFRLPLADSITIPMPKGADVLCVQIQHGEPTLWAKVDTDQDREMRHFAIIGTGPVNADIGRYIGTVQDGAFVWHIFEAVAL